jgi:hypothetical protein
VDSGGAYFIQRAMACGEEPQIHYPELESLGFGSERGGGQVFGCLVAIHILDALKEAQYFESHVR